jgi:uncharacterized protein (DUF2164 family)
MQELRFLVSNFGFFYFDFGLVNETGQIQRKLGSLKNVVT